ncbi:MAG: hypothetical protein Q8922_00845 [Bacteroidota bacterium]|nr:hypothetical protein [Bacteroidota bacterium]MDP4232580.1 hypothetical protein [Bacteroidota bacterium]MDP4242966.1 hypothetical protein [Bacteroidota bacterium]MDP4286459.1 hypothetical protein [Bacteroidota bacterium]
MIVRSFLLIAFVALGAGCSQSLPPTMNTPPSSQPVDFFWTLSALESGMHYYMSPTSDSNDHFLISNDGSTVYDQTLRHDAFHISSWRDTISIDSIGMNSIFSLPAGYYFGDSAGRRPGDLKLLERTGLHDSGSWPAGLLQGPGLGAGITITAHILDHFDTLLVPAAIGPVASVSYGESYVIRYTHDDASGQMSPSFPIYWQVYFARSVGPVLIEEYSDTSGFSNSMKPHNLQSQAVLWRK